jgi:hypothetical protein
MSPTSYVNSNKNNFMSNINALVVCSFVALYSFVFAQQCPSIEFVYDNTGNRIQRQQILVVCNVPNTFRMNKDSTTIPISKSFTDSIQANAFPNPTQKSVVIAITDSRIPKEEPKSLYLLDVNGRILYQQDVQNNQYEVDMHLYRQGNYFLVLTYADKKKIFQIIKID